MTAFPTVHLNGTSGKELFEQNRAAMEAVAKALEAIYAAAPNKRDYYVQADGDNAFSDAREAHFARAEMLTRIEIELEAIALKIQEQMP